MRKSLIPKKKSTAEEYSGVRGSFRLQITEDGEVVGDSGWHTNQITNLGYNYFLVSALATGVASSSQVGYISLGTGAIAAATDTSMAGETAKRVATTGATSSTSKTLHLTATFSSSISFVAGNSNLSNIGLFASSTAGTLFAGNTYASSTCATNQNVNVTYDITFGP